MVKFIRLDVTVLEDLHTGAGTGGGDIDDQVQRDRYGRPVVRASHLRGLLRDAADELVCLSKLTKGEVDGVFGQAGGKRSALRMTALRVTEGGKSVVWGSTARRAGGREPDEDKLRYVEHVAAGTRFRATLRLAGENYWPLLQQVLRRLDRIGGDRNRGAGLVLTEWKEIENHVRSASGGPDPGATRFRLVLRNLEPLCLPATGHPRNLIRSHSFIRGQTLRGALMAWGIAQGITAKWWDSVEVGDGLPLPGGVSQAERVLPIPLSLMTMKPQGLHGSRLPWWAGGSAEPVAFDALGRKRDPNEEKPKRPGPHEYLCRNSAQDAWLRYSPSMAVRLRNQTPKGKETEANLFSLEEIAEDTWFQAELMFASGSAAQNFGKDFAALLSGGDWLAVGRGGQPVTVESFAPIPNISNAITVRDDSWTLTLTSDLILRGSHLGFLDDLGISELCALVGMDHRKAERQGWTISDREVETEILHGFNAASGLHRVPAVAIRRGSCWQISGVDSGGLAVKLTGPSALGERTHEGCGRFVIGIQPIRTLARPEHRGRPAVRNRQEELLSKAKELANKLGTKEPSPSQLQWLRSRALACRSDQELANLLEEVRRAPKRRPRSGGAWIGFPVDDIEQAHKEARNHIETAHLVSYLVHFVLQKGESAGE